MTVGKQNTVEFAGIGGGEVWTQYRQGHPDEGGSTFLRKVGSYKSHAA
jgi:hypothetical protein